MAKATLAGEVAVSGANSQVVVDSGLAGADLIAMGSMSNVVTGVCSLWRLRIFEASE